MIYSKTWTCKCVYNIYTAMYKCMILHMKYVYAQKYIMCMNVYYINKLKHVFSIMFLHVYTI